MAYVETYVERDLKLLQKPLRLGLLLPSSNTAMEEELARMLPGNDVTIHASRVRLTDVTPEALIEMENTSGEAALQLADAGVDIIEYTCSAKLGYEHDREFAASLERLTNVPAVPYTEGVVEGLRSLGARRIAIASPYIAEVDELETEFYEGAGFDVVNIQGFGIIDNVKSGLVSPESWYSFVKEVDRPDADAIFISCTQSRTLEALDGLEQELGKPVVAANVAALWIMLKRTGYQKRISGYGTLLETLGG